MLLHDVLVAHARKHHARWELCQVVHTKRDEGMARELHVVEELVGNEALVAFGRAESRDVSDLIPPCART